MMDCAVLLSLAITPAPTVRRATAEDVQAIARVLVDTRRTSNREQLPASYLAELTYEKTEVEFQKAVTHPEPNQITLVTQLQSGVVIGFVNGKPTIDAPGDSSIEMKELYVQEDFQRKGVGESLVGQFMREALCNNTQQVYVWVLSTNQNARHFYEKLGAQYVRNAERVIGGETCGLSVYVWPEDIMRRLAGGNLGKE
jgi:ribosomal protein S18 acetylase RimI-like enzyme